MGRHFDLVILDCDGVLIDSEIISLSMLISELAARGVHVDLDYVSRNFLGRSYPTVMRQIRDQFGLDLPSEFETQYRDRLLAAFQTDLKVMPGVRAALDGLALPRCVAPLPARNAPRCRWASQALAILSGHGCSTPRWSIAASLPPICSFMPPRLAVPIRPAVW